MKKKTIDVTITLRGTPTAIAYRLATGFTPETLKDIRDGIVREIKTRRRKPARLKRPGKR